MALFRSPRALLAATLLAGITLRLPFILFEQQAGVDLEEFLNIARHLAAGDGFLLSIKAYHAVPGPLVHYGLHERPPLLPLIYAGLSFRVGGHIAAQWLGSVLFMIAGGLAWDLVRRYWGLRAAAYSTAVLLLHPGLLALSLRSESETLVVFFIILALWARFAVKSGLLTGMAVALLFLSRPNAVVPGLFVLASFLSAGPAWRKFLLGALVSLAGPVLVVLLNCLHGAPPLLLPQSFLFSQMSFTDQLRYFHANPIYESTAALFADRGAVIARTVLKNAFHYLRLFFDPFEGVALFIPLLGLSLAGIARSSSRGLIVVMFALIGWDLAFHTLLWFTFAMRFLAVPLAMTLVLIPAGIFAWTSHAAGPEGTPRRAAIPWLLMWPPLLACAVVDSYHGYIAVREYQLGRPMSGNLESRWDPPGMDRMIAALPVPKGGRPDSLVVASNEPWLVSRRTRLASCLLPWDLEADEWIPFIERQKTDAVLLVDVAWEEKCRVNLEELKAALAAAGWTKSAEAPGLGVWLPAPDRGPVQ